MQQLAIRYCVCVVAILAGFSAFVSCGASAYKVSLAEDHDRDAIPAESRDPNSPNYGLHAPGGWIELPIVFRTGTRLTEDQLLGLRRAMHTWEIAAGQQLFEFDGLHEGRDGDSFLGLYGSLPDYVNGYYLSSDWSKTGKPDEVLATTIWENVPGDPRIIETADIRFNVTHYILGDSLVVSSDGTREVVDMESLALHELGHLLGLAHISPRVDGYSIMNPQLYIGEGFISRTLSRSDVKRLQKIYGCAGDACDLDSVMERLEAFAQTAFDDDAVDDFIDARAQGDEIFNDDPISAEVVR